MRQRVIAAVAACAVLAGLIYWWAGREPSRAPETETASSEQAPRIATPVATESKSPAAPAPRFAPPVAADADPVGTLRLEGQVIDENDAFIAGATVVLSSTPRQQTVTGEDGTFTFEKLVGKQYRVLARKGAETGSATRRLSEESEPLIVRIREAAHLDVTVVAAPEGTPVVGAKVSLVAQDLEVVTDGDGKARMDGVSGFGLVSVAADGFAPAQVMTQVPTTPGAVTTLRVALRRGVAVKGRVVDEAGSPVAGAAIVAVSSSDPLASGDDSSGVESGADGTFAIPAVAAGTYRIAARHKKFAPGASELISIGKQEIDDVEIVLTEGASLAGRVVDSDGNGVAWATVQLQVADSGARTSWQAARSATADDMGVFELTGLPAKLVSVAATGEKVMSEVREVDLGRKPKTTGLELVLDVRGTISGQVVDSRGEPVPEVTVMAMPDVFAGADLNHAFLRGSSSATTDGAGGFEIGPLASGPYRVVVSKNGDWQQAWRRKGTPAQTGDRDVKLILAAEGGIKGKVAFEDGSTPKAGTVEVNSPPGTPFTGGKFEVSALEPGKYDVTARGPGFSAAVVRDVVVEPGEVSDLGVVKVTRGRTISGRVVDAGGNPVAGAKVAVAKQLIGDGSSLTSGSLSSFMTGARSAESDERGHYRVTGVGAGALVLAAEHSEHGRALPIEVAAGTESLHLDLVLSPFGAVAGRVTLGSEPLAGATVMATHSGSPRASVIVNAGDDGAFQFERLPAGEHTITAMAGGPFGAGGMSGERVMVVGGEEVQVEISIEAGEIELSVDVSGKGGAHIDAAQVFAFEGDVDVATARELQEHTIGGGGAKMRFSFAGKPAVFDGLTPGPRSVCVIPINGDMSDSQFLSRLQAQAEKLAVYCSSYQLQAAEKERVIAIAVPPMTPLDERLPAP